MKVLSVFLVALGIICGVHFGADSVDASQKRKSQGQGSGKRKVQVRESLTSNSSEDVRGVFKSIFDGFSVQLDRSNAKITGSLEQLDRRISQLESIVGIARRSGSEYLDAEVLDLNTLQDPLPAIQPPRVEISDDIRNKYLSVLNVIFGGKIGSTDWRYFPDQIMSSGSLDNIIANVKLEEIEWLRNRNKNNKLELAEFLKPHLSVAGQMYCDIHICHSKNFRSGWLTKIIRYIVDDPRYLDRFPLQPRVEDKRNDLEMMFAYYEANAGFAPNPEMLTLAVASARAAHKQHLEDKRTKGRERKNRKIDNTNGLPPVLGTPNLLGSSQSLTFPQPRKSYPVEFRQRAIDLVHSGRNFAEVSRELGVSDTAVSNWVKRDRHDRAHLEQR